MKKQPKIVIVDDVQTIRRVLKASFIKAGFNDISEATNGEELLQKLEETPFDLIICDWDMPKMSGIDALHHIRNNEAYKHIPFVMVTAVTDAAQVKQAIDIGISDYIIKPIKPDLFIDKMKKVLLKQNIYVPSSA